MKTLVLTIAFLLIAVVLLGVKVMFVKGGRFPSGHVHDIPALRDRGIGCAASGGDKPEDVDRTLHSSIDQK